MSNHKLFLGGIPYAIEVKKLSDMFPVPELAEGRVISHADLETVLDLKQKTQRYYGVINAWIKKQKNENGIVITWQAGEGVKVLNPAEVLGHAETHTRQKSKQLGRAVRLFGWVDRNRLDETGKRRLDHQVIVAAKIASAVQESQKELAVELAPVRSLPKRIA